jgi:hypothetical protein
MGTKLFSIGTPDRSAAEFKYGDQYRQWGLYYKFPKDFPNGVNWIVKNNPDPRKDWNYGQPQIVDGGDTIYDNLRNIGSGNLSESNFRITFEYDGSAKPTDVGTVSFLFLFFLFSCM